MTSFLFIIFINLSLFLFMSIVIHFFFDRPVVDLITISHLQATFIGYLLFSVLVGFDFIVDQYFSSFSFFLTLIFLIYFNIQLHHRYIFILIWYTRRCLFCFLCFLVSFFMLSNLQCAIFLCFLFLPVVFVYRVY